MGKHHEVEIFSVFIANQDDTFVTTKTEEAVLEYGGIPGDLHFGLTKFAGARESMYKRGTEIFNRRQISIVSVEECAWIAEKLEVEQILPEWLGANIAIKGLGNLTKLAPGSRIVFPSGAGILCEGENLPCTQPGEVIQHKYPANANLTTRFVKASLGQRGIVGIVECPGKIRTGDTAKVIVNNV
ncbi:MOSC domain-containing protein [Virgibacillus sp. NKC19-3]|uniref:MOSC domain-containing protein n=1 Tax=Virgibacillus saliphilus TaxID=2831674 RepID=UPI001C9BB293|nr:MOSC domain-containing protein [Virgibacillus sp. NKC19-3]MBY7144845.1 MOSC domain-containing protein [Virgibacillus sp. NKC19-3]